MNELNKNWENELALKNEILSKNAFDLTTSDKSFLNFVKLKESFHVEALDMVDWINKEIANEKAMLESYIYFMDKGFMNYQPDRYDYRTAVFNDIKEAIQNDKPYNIYDIVHKWDMWYHS
jgi:hypothetical protein